MNQLICPFFALCFGAIMVCQTCCPGTSLAQSFFDGVRAEVNGTNNVPKNQHVNQDNDHDNEDNDEHHQHGRGKRRRNNNHFDGCNNVGSQIIGDVTGAILFEGLKCGVRTACFCPPPIDGDPDSRIVFRGFQPYPYFDPDFGRYCADLEQPNYEHYSHQLTTEWLVSDQHVDTLRTRLLFESINRFGVDTEFAYLRQRSGGNDLYLGDANVIYRFSQHATMQGRIGIGINYLADNSNWDSGFNFTYGGDIFLAKPLILSADVDWGTLGSTNLIHARTTLGIIRRHTELFAGYDYLSIGAPKQQSFVTGLRFWF